jgi:tetratricopeptide (TPR) repeat protein
MPGVGKSYLADQFAIEGAGDFPGGTESIVLQPEESRPAEALADALLGQLADRLHVVCSPEQMPARVRDRLRAPLTLLHVENVDSEAAASAVVRLVEWLRGCAVIVTGRYRALGNEAGWVRVPVAEFDEATALEQLEAELAGARALGNREDLRRLARELGYLPLALHLAAGYLREGGYDASTFLGELRRSGFDLDPNHPGDRLLLSDPRRANLHRTFELSLALLGRQLGAGAEMLVAGLRALGHAPLGGFGRSLGETIAGLSGVDFARLMNAAGKLSLVVPAEAREDDAWRVHPLLAEWLRQGVDEAAVLGWMTGWFVERLPVEKAGEAWDEVTREGRALAEWLARVDGEDLVPSQYAMLNGPFHVWMVFCERGLKERSDPEEQSGLLWILAIMARSAGAMDKALEAARRKAALDREQGDERGAALAAECRADILQDRGQLDEALRILQTEELPVYERLGNTRGLLVGRVNLALNLLARSAPGDRDQAAHLLHLAHAAAVELRIPEASEIRDIQQHYGLPI